MHDHLSTERYLYEGSAEFDEGNVLLVLADMIKQRLIAIDDLQGLHQTKVSKVKAMSMFQSHSNASSEPTGNFNAVSVPSRSTPDR